MEYIKQFGISKDINKARQIVFGADDYNNKVKNIISKYGNIEIVSGIIHRHQIPKYINSILNFASFGEFEKQNPYDKLFHLSVIFTLQNGTKILVEKNEVINMEINPKLNNFNDESLIINKPFNNLTLNKALENTQKRMGNNYFSYQASHNNCQNFILNILESNGLLDDENKEFIKQNTEKIFNKLPHLKKLSDAVTGIAGKVDIIKNGGNCKCSKCSNGLNSQQIEQLIKKANIKNFNGVYSKNKIKQPLKKGWYILNMENYEDGDGTHWVCYYHDEPKALYSDSFGIIPPVEILELVPNKLLYTTQQIQNEKSTCCGYFCIAFILCHNDLLSPEMNLKTYEAHFSKNNLITNDFILRNILYENGLKPNIHL
jgi:hypothetical protein